MLICADRFIESHAGWIARLKHDLMPVPYGWAAEMNKWSGHAKQLEKAPVKSFDPVTELRVVGSFEKVTEARRRLLLP